MCSILKKPYSIICPKCGKTHIEYITEYKYNVGKYKLYCSRSCANGHKHSVETKYKISLSLLNNKISNEIWEIKNPVNRLISLSNELHISNVINYTIKYKPFKLHKCPICKKLYFIKFGFSEHFCSYKCYSYYLKNKKNYLSSETLHKLSEAGKHSSYMLNEHRRSKNEILFYSLCELYFNNVEHNKPIFNGWDADIIIHDIKYAILWNGKWHYQKIKKQHSVELVLNRDRIKIKEILIYGYVPYIIKDMGKYNEQFVKELFDIFVKHITSFNF